MRIFRFILVMTVPLLISSQSITTEQRIIDADTIKISGKKVRLNGVDAPELAQKCKDLEGQTYNCGVKATQKLQELLNTMPKKSIECAFTGKDVYGRLLGECSIGKININSWLVLNGWAFAYHKYSMKYINDEVFAMNNSTGLWNGTFIKPWRWRTGDRLDTEIETPKSDCFIKGNISSSGEKIYHTQTDRNYDDTKISLNAGEKWFCSEEEAIQNGWRKSKR